MQNKSSAPIQDQVSGPLNKMVNDLHTFCSQNGVPMIMAFQNEKKHYEAIITSGASAGGAHHIRMMDMLLKSVDVDQFLHAVFLEAQKNGHKSLFLKAMGIPDKPE